MVAKQTPAALVRELKAASTPERLAGATRFFKTSPGEYGEGDVFLGVTVPDVRRIARGYRSLGLDELEKLLHAKQHEVRLAALILLVAKTKRADAADRKQILDLYLRNTRFINNWDLVDVSCREIAGEFLLANPSKSKQLLTRLARSESLWERRIAIISTMTLVRNSRFDEALRIATLLLSDPHDLIHKAVGWVLREVGDKDRSALLVFIEAHYARMPRTALRYAIEHLSADERARILRGDFAQSARSTSRTSAGSGRTRKSA